MKLKNLAVILLVGLITACGTQVTEIPTLTPTETPIPATEAPPPTATATPTEEPTPDPSIISFEKKVLPVLLSRCVVCHGGVRGTEEGLTLRTYDDLIKGSDNGPVITPGDAEASLLVELITKQEMPKRGPKLTPPQVQRIIDWVNQGALNN